MSGRGLLSRIGGSRQHRGDSGIDGIIAHLDTLLNTRQGECECRPEFGIPDFSDIVHGFPGSVAMLERAIRDTILEFEPRIESVTVRLVEDKDPLVLPFEIHARLARDRNTTLRLKTRMGPGGIVSVSR